MAKKKVALDAGHAGFGKTAGKRTPDGEYEWDFNNKVIVAATEYLKNYNEIEVVRLDDPTGKRDVPLKERTDKANRENVDIGVSHHHNANTGKWGTWTGTETYTYVGNWEEAEKLAKIVHNKVVDVYGLRNRGLKKADFHMLRESKAPFILVEGGYMDSKIDIKKLRNDDVLKRAGYALAEGVLEYFGINKKSNKGKVVTPPKSKVDSVSTTKPSSSKSKDTYKTTTAHIGMRVESKVNTLRFYSKPSWDDKYVVGHVDKGVGFPKITAKYKVEDGYQYQVQNSRGATYYITASTEYVDVISGKKSSSSSKPASKKSTTVKVGSKVKLKTSASKYATGQTIPSYVKGKTYTVQQVKSDRVLLKEIYSWVYKKDIS